MVVTIPEVVHQTDVQAEHGIDITMQQDFVWINIDGICALRVKLCDKAIVNVNINELRLK